VRPGYDRWSEVYDHDGNALVALEDPIVCRAVGDPRGAGFRVQDTGEHGLDAAFAARFPRAAKYVDRPTLVVLRLAKARPGTPPSPP
jgi:hypothetical protein